MNTPAILAFLGNLGPWEIVMIMAVILLLFGGKKIPELSRGVAKGLKVFKTEMNDVKKQFKEAADEVEKEDETKTDDKA